VPAAGKPLFQAATGAEVALRLVSGERTHFRFTSITWSHCSWVMSSAFTSIPTPALATTTSIAQMTFGARTSLPQSCCAVWHGCR
jgi:hypothetical protein